MRSAIPDTVWRYHCLHSCVLSWDAAEVYLTYLGDSYFIMRLAQDPSLCLEIPYSRRPPIRSQEVRQLSL